MHPHATHPRSLVRCLHTALLPRWCLSWGRKGLLKPDITERRGNGTKPRGGCTLSTPRATLAPIPDAQLSHFRLRPVVVQARGTALGTPWDPAGPPPARRLFRSLTGDGFRGNGSFLKAPLTPGLTQRFFPLHLRGGVLRRHQGLRSWGHRIASFRIFFFLNDHHPNALGVGNTADSTRRGRAQESQVPGGDSEEPRGAEGPRSREAINIQDNRAGRGTK